MKLEVGMYVRTKGGYIEKIISFKSTISNDYVELEDKYYANKKDILKASHNIIDLIEVGDIVEVELDNDNGMNKFEVVGVAVETNEIGIFKDDYSIYGVDIKNIKSIVTKEQFEAMQYEIK